MYRRPPSLVQLYWSTKEYWYGHNNAIAEAMDKQDTDDWWRRQEGPKKTRNKGVKRKEWHCCFCFIATTTKERITQSGGQTSFIPQKVVFHFNCSACFVKPRYQEVIPPSLLRMS